jgi:protein gp37
MGTDIQWTDETWNPVTGCAKVSPGCAHCYAETIAKRLWASSYPPIPIAIGQDGQVSASRPRQFTDVQCHADRLEQPLRWKKPRRIFVNSMSDLFHEDVPDAFIDRVFAVMALAPQHTFQILTKRAERMRDYMLAEGRTDSIAQCLPTYGTEREGFVSLPLSNVWLGVSVENQRFADERIPLLLQTPASVRFISAEPLLGLIDLASWFGIAQLTTVVEGERVSTTLPLQAHKLKVAGYDNFLNKQYSSTPIDVPWLDWVIVGGESGAGARPFDIAWARSIVQQCQAAGVPVFVKQLGARSFTPNAAIAAPLRRERGADGNYWLTLRDHKGGEMAEWPEDLRVREFPKAVAP